ncbi:unnamed protein product, partial [Sphagnum compactum]
GFLELNFKHMESAKKNKNPYEDQMIELKSPIIESFKELDVTKVDPSTYLELATKFFHKIGTMISSKSSDSTPINQLQCQYLFDKLLESLKDAKACVHGLSSPNIQRSHLVLKSLTQTWKEVEILVAPHPSPDMSRQTPPPPAASVKKKSQPWPQDVFQFMRQHVETDSRCLEEEASESSHAASPSREEEEVESANSQEKCSKRKSDEHPEEKSNRCPSCKTQYIYVLCPHSEHQKIHSNLSSLNTFTKKTSSTNMKSVLIR